ncbi:hypothetical protein E3O28_14910 [Cryobacterium sp. TMT2-14]|nr:hypothetical protein E3O28_14910 [Cryobacterium sp. TMT2-14]
MSPGAAVYQPAFVGVVAAVTGFAGSFVLVIAGLQAVGATDSQTAPVLLAPCLLVGIDGVLYPEADRQSDACRHHVPDLPGPGDGSRAAAAARGAGCSGLARRGQAGARVHGAGDHGRGRDHRRSATSLRPARSGRLRSGERGRIGRRRARHHPDGNHDRADGRPRRAS